MSDVTVSIDLDASPGEVWEIVEPVEAHSGGIIRFQCRVR